MDAVNFLPALTNSLCFPNIDPHHQICWRALAPWNYFPRIKGLQWFCLHETGREWQSLIDDVEQND
jgi:hypothetical protein